MLKADRKIRILFNVSSYYLLFCLRSKNVYTIGRVFQVDDAETESL